MLKRILAITLTLVMLLSCGVYAYEGTMPTTFEKPQNVAVRADGDSTFIIRWTDPESMIKFAKDIEGEGYDLYYVVDWKKNNGNWNIGDMTPDSSNYNDEIHGYFFNYFDSILRDSGNAVETFHVTWHLDPNASPADSFDLVNNTYYFRVRYALNYEDDNGNAKVISSPYTNEVAIGKDAVNTTITKLDAPRDLKVEVRKDNNGKPYFHLNWTVPESITNANKQLPVYHRIDFKVGDEPWKSETTSWDWMHIAPSRLLTSSEDFDPVEKDLIDKIVIEENTYHFRILFECEPSGNDVVRSEFSNIASTRVEEYSNAHDWAKPELDKAAKYGLITDKIKNKMNSPITREEFAELSVRLYEVFMKTKATPVSPNPFKDCTNPEVLKANKLGIIFGVATDTFKPLDLTNREQIAAMLNRAAKAMKPDADFSTVGAPEFKDQDIISGYALENIKYMSKSGFILGSDGYFDPKGTATCEQAVLIAVRVYEFYSK